MNPITIPSKPDQPLKRGLTLHRLHIGGGPSNLKTVNAVIFDEGKEADKANMVMAVVDEAQFIEGLYLLFPQLKACRDFIEGLAAEKTEGEMDDDNDVLENDTAVDSYSSRIWEAREVLEKFK
jgi:hypothetical protein